MNEHFPPGLYDWYNLKHQCILIMYIYKDLGGVGNTSLYKDHRKK